MNTKFTIKNFRVFDENGATIDLKPLTILTGCNSSGKSTIVKAAFLLNSFMKQVSNAIEKGEEIQLSKYKLDFTSYPNNLLGRFDKVLPKGSSSRKVTLGYTIHSGLIFKDVSVELVFSTDVNDELNNGYLVCLSMSTDDGVFYCSDKEEGSFYNLNIIKQYLAPFVKAKIVVDDTCNLCAMPIDEEIGISEKAFEEEKAILVPQLKDIGKDNIMDIARYMRFKDSSKSLTYTKDQQNLLDWTENSGSFFKIPVLDYLRSIKKADICSVVKKELISDNEKNTYLAKPSVVLSASEKILDDFMASPFEMFDDYFKDYECRFFEHAVTDGNNCPCLAETSISQDFLTKHPHGFYGSSGGFFLGDEDEPSFKQAKTTEQKLKEWDEMPLTFEDLYSVIMIWNEKFVHEDSEYYIGGCDYMDLPEGTFETPGSFHHKSFDMLTEFADKLIHEAISVTGLENMSYVSSSRATVKKLYVLDEKDNFTELLQKYFDAKRFFEESKRSMKPDYKVNDFINRWIKHFELGNSLSFKLDEEGLGVKIRLHKSADDNGRLLSDEGYGITQLFSIMLQIETAIISSKNKKASINYGLKAIDQYDTNAFHFEENTIAVEEPEIHLHPRFQSMLAEMFVDAFKNYNIHFIVETHSEYLIRKLQVMVAEKDCRIQPEDISLNYVDKGKTGISFNKHIHIQKDGNLDESFGSGFYDEADALAIQLFRNKPILS